MYSASDIAVQKLCRELQIDSDFLVQCLHASVIEVHETEGHLVLGNGTVLLLRRLERICVTLNVDISGALLLLKLTQRVADLEEENRLLREARGL